MRTRRDFLRNVGAAAVLPAFNPFKAEDVALAARRIAHLSPQQAAADEDYWASVQQAYTVSSNIINLNNGGVSPQPLVVQDALDRYTRMANEAPTYYMWRIMDQGREPLRYKLADLAGCSPDELAVNRNSTEALATIIFGLTLRKGDEVVLTKQDYPNMIQAWKQREMRDEIKLKWVNLDLPIENDEAIVQKFVEQFTPRTKVVYITHMINWTGQILPVRKIADAARARGCEVIVDAAHTFAHLDFKIPDLGADYLGTSLHKWLSAPFGSGLLYVKKDKIKSLYPLFPNVDPKTDDIRKFEVLGTRSFAVEQAIGQSMQRGAAALSEKPVVRTSAQPAAHQTEHVAKTGIFVRHRQFQRRRPGTGGNRGVSVQQVQDSHSGNRVGKHQRRACDTACLYAAERFGQIGGSNYASVEKQGFVNFLCTEVRQ